jgi:PmbA protein
MMSLSIKKYFEEAKKNGIEPYQVSYSTSTEASVEVHNGNVEVQQIGTTQDISAKGIHDGKQGSFSTDCIDKYTPSMMAENVLQSSLYGKEEKAEDYFHGGLKYRKTKPGKITTFKPSTLKELRDFALAVYEDVKAKDDRLTKITVAVSMQTAMSQKFNSYGVKCKDTASYYVCSISVVAENDKKEPRSGYKGCHSFYSLEDLKEKTKEIIPDVISSAIDFFGSSAMKTKKYKVLLSRNSVSSLLAYFLGQLNAKNVQQHLSLFEGKMDTQIVSKSLTMKNIPYAMSLGASNYDADGYPTKEFTFIRNGVLKDYFYSVETANKDHRDSNGCCSGNGNGGPIVVSVKPGKYDLDALFEKVRNGLYITSVSGLNSGINSQTLDFSLPCEGYVIKDGKKDKAFSMMVVAGNLSEVFNSVLAIGNDVDEANGRFIPSMIIKSLTVSGK